MRTEDLIMHEVRYHFNSIPETKALAVPMMVDKISDEYGIPVDYVEDVVSRTMCSWGMSSVVLIVGYTHKCEVCGVPTQVFSKEHGKYVCSHSHLKQLSKDRANGIYMRSNH